MASKQKSTMKRSALSQTLEYIFYCLLFLLVAMTLYLAWTFISQKLYGISEVSSQNLSSAPVVIIDAGHGGEDGGTSGASGVLEKDLNLEIALTLNDMLTAGGFQTIMTRTEDILLYDRNSDYAGHKKAQDLSARKKIADENPDAVFVSIHMNSFPQKQYKGLQVYYSVNHADSMEVAASIQKAAATYLQPDNSRRIKAASDGIFLLKHIMSPAVLVECGFLSNDEECALLQTEEYRKKLSFVLFSSIVQYISQSS